mmetsp:Transcript_10577/g.28241  ORF Transcript_10577/g.28241 Transcript_10577/m.28241 type:complete len:273 (-) Transcript_10577:566-1384(-)
MRHLHLGDAVREARGPGGLEVLQEVLPRLPPREQENPGLPKGRRPVPGGAQPPPPGLHHLRVRPEGAGRHRETPQRVQVCAPRRRSGGHPLEAGDHVAAHPQAGGGRRLVPAPRRRSGGKELELVQEDTPDPGGHRPQPRDLSPHEARDDAEGEGRGPLRVLEDGLQGRRPEQLHARGPDLPGPADDVLHVREHRGRAGGPRLHRGPRLEQVPEARPPAGPARRALPDVLGRGPGQARKGRRGGRLPGRLRQPQEDDRHAALAPHGTVVPEG